MNTTFTNYAEKKAKQFFNLLQGYTKGIRTTAILILLLMGVSNAWGKIVYINVNNFQSYSSQIYVHYWNNGDGYVAATDLQNWLWMAEIPDGAEWQVLRSNGGTGDNDRYNWQKDCSAQNNIYHVTGWDNSGSSGYVNVFPKSKYIYFDVTGSQKWNEANFNTKFNWFLVNGLYKTSTWSKNKLSDGKYYTQVPDNHLEQIQLCRMDPNNDGSQWNYTNNAIVNNEYNCLYVPNDRLNWENTWVPAWKTYAPPMSSVTLTDNGTNIISGQGTNTNPYLVEVGTQIKVIASGTKEIEDPAATINYNFKQGNTSQQNGTNDTYSFNASSNSDVTYIINLESYTQISGVSGTSKSATALYYKTTTTEKKHNVTVSYKCGTTTIKDNTTTNNVGEVTQTTITAPDIIYGYTFNSWELGSGITQESVNGNQITITTKASGEYTLTAKYNENLSTDWSLAHSIDDFSTTSHKFTKKTGESAGKVAYVSVNLAASTNYKFKVVNGSKWYGNNNNNNGETYWIKNTVENWEFYDDAGDCYMKSSVAGTYTFKIDFSGSNPKISVYFPAAYTVTYGIGNNKGTDAVTTNLSITSGDLVLASTSIEFRKGATKAGYTWKNWNSKADGTGTILGTNNTYVSSNRTGDISVYACYDLIPYTITYYLDGGTNPNNAPTTYNVAAATTLPTPTRTGYTFEGWYDNVSLTGSPVSQIAKGSTEDKEFWAKWSKNSYTLTFGVQGSIGGNVRATVNGNAITSPATLEHGTQIAFTATADDKYKFSRWINGSTQISTETSFTHTLTADASIQAVFTNLSTLYLQLNNYWKNDVNNGVWFAAYFYKNGSDDNYWVKMKNENPCGGSDNYKVQIPDGNWTNVIFCRMKNDCHDLKWDCRWDQTQNLTIPTDGKNLFTINPNERGGDGNNNSGAKGSWDTHAPQNYEPVVFNVTVPTGTPNCYIIGDWDGWSQFTEMTKVDDTHYTVTIPDVCATSAKYKYCYGPSWGCEEVKNTYIPTEAIQDRTYHANDVVAAWISYYIVGYNGDWDTWNNGYKFDINGNLHVNLAAVKEHDFKIKSSTQKLYTTENQDGEKHKFNRSHTSERITEKESNWHALKLNVDVAGYYDFTYNPVSGLLTIAFPSKGYRLKITMTDGSGKVYTSNEVNNETETLSFFAPGSDDPQLKGTIILENQGNHVADIPASLFKTSGVYTAKLNSNKDGITEPVLYNGNYYIRTDGAHGGWNSYKTNSDNKMTYFVPREEEKYSYYWVEALPRASRDHTNGVVNVKACVANEYNENLAVMLEADKFTDGYGNVEIKDPSDYKREKVNVRFGYNPKTNFFERAMLSGSGNTNTFLNITAPDYVYLDNDMNVTLTTADKNSKFTDVSNWVYQKDIWVKPPTTGASVYLTAKAYNEEVNSLFGFDKNGAPIARKIIGTNSGELRKMRTIYDFKTNRMIIAWVPDAQNITTEQSLEADVLFIRHENEEVPQLTFTPNEGQIKGIQSQFFALELENARDKNAEEHYWISLPFDCVVGSISGVPGYMEIWGIQRYNGEERAQKGWFKETSTFWEWLEPDDVMKAGEGYVLSFDKKAATWNDFDVHDDDGNLTGTESLLRLYFPSTTKGFEFKNSQPEREYVNQPCTITRDNRHLQDGNWKIIGPMSYNNVKATPTKYGAGDDVWKPEQDGDHVDVPEGKYEWSAPMFRYKYWEDESGNNWKYIPENGTTNTYNSFFGYMVQFAGLIQWNSVSVSEPVLAGLTARRNTDTNERTNITMRLEIVNAEGKQQDQTFVALDVEATTTFDPNKDLNKIFNDGETNIYSLSEGIPFAGNALPMEEAIVPVGVQIAAEGEYIFRMPDGTEGMVVELIDYESNTRTNLLLSDYIVTLSKGTSENRFALHIQPQKDVVTSLENIGEGVNNGEAVNKYLIDGKLIIRTAEGIFDAQGHRL